MSSVEILEVSELDETFRYYRIEGTVPYSVRYKKENGLIYWRRVWAKDEIDAYMQVSTGNYTDMNLALMEQADEHDDNRPSRAQT